MWKTRTASSQTASSRMKNSVGCRTSRADRRNRARLRRAAADGCSSKDQPPDALGALLELAPPFEVEGPRPRQGDVDVLDDAAGSRRHDQHAIGEQDRLG